MINSGKSVGTIYDYATRVKELIKQTENIFPPDDVRAQQLGQLIRSTRETASQALDTYLEIEDNIISNLAKETERQKIILSQNEINTELSSRIQDTINIRMRALQPFVGKLSEYSNEVSAYHRLSIANRLPALCMTLENAFAEYSSLAQKLGRLPSGSAAKIASLFVAVLGMASYFHSKNKPSTSA